MRENAQPFERMDKNIFSLDIKLPIFISQMEMNIVWKNRKNKIR